MSNRRNNSPPDEYFETLFSQYARGLVVYAREFALGEEEAEDIVHDVFVSLWERMETLSVDTAKAYLFRAARNRCLDHLAHLRVRSKYQEKILKEQKPSDALDMDYYVETELRAYIDTAIAALPPQRRRIFTMNRLDGRPVAEIAVELNLSQRTVEKHIELAVRQIRTGLVQYLAVLLLLVYN